MLIRPQTLLTRSRGNVSVTPPEEPALLAWDDTVESDALALIGTFETVQLDGEDMVIELDPRGLAHVLLRFDFEASPSEFHEWRLLTSPDNVNWDTMPFITSTVGNTGGLWNRAFFVEGVRYFKIIAALMDTDGTPGGDDVGTTLTAYVRKEAEA